MSDKLPPHSDEAERGSLGCLLLAPDKAKSMLSKLHQSDFFDPRHRETFTACFCLAVDSKPLDTVLLVQWLKDQGRLDAAGGLAYVAELQDATPSAANFDYYVEILKEKANRREVLANAAALKELALDEAIEPDAFAEKAKTLTASIGRTRSHEREWFHFYKPSECRNYEPPEGLVLVGDSHIVRGSVTVIGGPAGVGKSRATHALAISGKTGEDWLGRKVHRQFRTAILQNENGRLRLKQDFTEGSPPDLDDLIRVSGPPPFGMAFDNPGFRAQLADWLADWLPDVVVLDPWNSAARDDGQRDYLTLFNALREVLPKGEDAPALVIDAHTRKPRADERSTGRNLLNEIAGSHVIGSVARSAFVMLHASDAVTDDRVVWTCVKNNDGELGGRSAWHRRNGLFVRCEDFSWSAFDKPGKEATRHAITKETLESLFDHGQRKLNLKDGAQELQKRFGFGKSASYSALALEGRFKRHLSEDPDGCLSWIP